MGVAAKGRKEELAATFSWVVVRVGVGGEGEEEGAEGEEEGEE